ncbi:YbaB/EbfC family nucleoid-associated protein [Streptosporangium sp. NBC_01469]|uniref:YbaB/EbfC family nucleoid-associated protein n=1 Tax=Streptosporangium sp. NBC_01469 TaxID=2903898 RepID=UPI002E2DEEB5|nr:YbaB/EbfC family nucleoid-associated protein [Streptosporangium sp. NBC_01469]
MFGYDIDPSDIRPRDIVKAEEQLDRFQALLAAREEQLTEIVGTGEGDSGHVRATVASDGRVIEVTLDPRAVKGGSEALSEQILLAVHRAQQNAQRQADGLLHETLQEALPGTSIDLTAIYRQARSLLD